MQINQSLDFEFSGCDYHPPPPSGVPFDHDLARAFLREAGCAEPTRYQLNLYRDLFLAFGRALAARLHEIEPEVRAEVKRRRGFDDWSAGAVAERESVVAGVGS